MYNILRLNLLQLLRSYIPNSFLRYFLIAIVVLLVLLGLIAGVIFGLNPPPAWHEGLKSRNFMNNLSGILAVINNSILFIPVYLTIRGALSLLENSKIALLTTLAPISSASKFWATIGPLIVFTAFPFFIFTGPFLVMFLFIDPLVSIVLVLYFSVLSAWTVSLTLMSVVLLVRYFGKKKAARLSYLLPAVLLIIPGLFTAGSESFRKVAPLIGYWQIIFFSISLVVLPIFFNYICRLYFSYINIKLDLKTTASEPIWGEYLPWLYLWRKGAFLSIVPIAMIALVLLFDLFDFEVINEALLSLTIILVATIPITLLMADEHLVHARWRLAPNAGKIKKILWLKVNFPLIIIASIALIIKSDLEHLEWFFSNLALIFIGMLVLTSHRMSKFPRYQKILYLGILICTMITQWFW